MMGKVKWFILSKLERIMSPNITEKPSKQTSDRMRKVKNKDTVIEKSVEKVLKQIYVKSLHNEFILIRV